VKSFKILFKKSLRDFLREMKQFIAIIFILAVSVTLFSGLEANAIELERRVNEEYESGNLADVWITFNQYNEDEYNNILEIAEGENTNSNLKEDDYINKRLYMPFLVDNTNAYVSLSDEYPTINKGYDIELSNEDTFNSDFYFLVDSGFKKRYPSLETGDTLPVSFDTSLIKASLLNIANLAIDNAYPNQDTTIIKATVLTYLNSVLLMISLH